MGEKTISLGLIAGRHDMPVDGYVLENVPDAMDMDGIHKTVFSSLEKILGPYIRITDYGPAVNGTAEDEAHYECSAKLLLYITGLTAAALEVLSFCAQNGVSITAMYFDREAGDYVRQPLL